MNILKLLADLAATPTTQFENSTPRREALGELRRIGAKTLAAALPLGLGALPTQARTTRTILDSLQLALQLERLQSAFYTRALTAPASFFPADGSIRASIVKMQAHQQQHVALLTRLISSNAAIPALPTYDFTGSKNNTQPALFPNVFSNFDQFLTLAQLLEDTGVRAYKAQVEFLTADNYTLQTALQLHSTEARHAARIRTIRRQRAAVVKPWPSPTDASITVAGKTDVVYATEHATTQVIYQAPTSTGAAGTYKPVPFRLLPIGSGMELLTVSVPEAFDEPLSAEEAEALLGLFTY
ncbi:ferritin-like domain-containing protein [Hymenobacter tibetensis]|uniref:Ferritin-like domain-containing protein n=1 Tax=Hymenobacter tibetensis TaxID=497967 RepID=A0ABY4CV37_9BACT|nr:ferritin-like domain-containing protein [Hymenobacter tibetensis]UOG74125.1 ferritin-like domain-containing protein [Hymenobacter tibetensis]